MGGLTWTNNLRVLIVVPICVELNPFIYNFQNSYNLQIPSENSSSSKERELQGTAAIIPK